MTSILKVSSIQDPTNSNTALSIDSSGIVTTPARPAFLVRRTGDITLTEGNDHQIIPFNTVKFDIGSNYSTTDFNYTCPVDGIYFFSLSFRADSVASGGYIRAIIYKGSDASTTIAPFQAYGDSLATITGNQATNYETHNISGVLQCNSGDIVTPMGGHNSDTSFTFKQESTFSGYLVG